MTYEELADVFRAAGFEVERAFQYCWEGLPSRFHYGSRENTALIARKTS
jgi:hypothetical protein